jgi:hypothetical protein
MRTLFTHNADGLINNDKQFLQLNQLCPQGNRRANQQTSNYVQLEIAIDTLKILINEQMLAVEEFRCLNTQSKYAIHRTVMMSLLGK